MPQPEHPPAAAAVARRYSYHHFGAGLIILSQLYLIKTHSQKVAIGSAIITQKRKKKCNLVKWAQMRYETWMRAL